MLGIVMSAEMEKNYTYRGKYMHLKTKKHNRNLHNNVVTGNNNVNKVN